MAHYVLAVTSWLMLVVHLYIVNFMPGGSVMLCLMYVAGPVTSIWNHTTTSAQARLADRVVMAVGLVCDWAHAATVYEGAYVIAMSSCAVGLYVLAKAASGFKSRAPGEGIMVIPTALHVMAHGLVTVTHAWLWIALWFDYRSI